MDKGEKKRKTIQFGVCRLPSLQKKTCVKKKSFTSVVDGRATENDGGAETESQG